MKRRQILVFCIVPLVLLCTIATAHEEAAKSAQWNGDVGVGLSLTTGNTETMNLSLSFIAKKMLSTTLSLENSGSFLLGRVDNTTNTETLSLISRLNWQHSGRFFSFVELQGMRDRFKNYDYRFLPNAGIGLMLLSTEKTKLSLDAGFSGVFTRFHDPDKTDSYAGLTLGNQVTWKISSTSEFSQKLTFTTGLSDLSRCLARLEMSLSAALSKKMALKVSLVDNYENKPVGEGIIRNDLALVAGLSMKY